MYMTLREEWRRIKEFAIDNAYPLAFGGIILILGIGGGYYLGRKVGEAGEPNTLYNTEWRKLFRKD